MIPAIHYITTIYTYILVHPLARAPETTTASLPRGPPWRRRRWRQIHHAITPDNRTSDNGGPTLQHTFPPYRGPQAQPQGGRRSPVVACWASDHWVASFVINFASLSPASTCTEARRTRGPRAPAATSSAGNGRAARHNSISFDAVPAAPANIGPERQGLSA